MPTQEELAYYRSLFPGPQGDPAGFDPTAGAMPPAAAGPPGMEGLEGGWSHINSDPMAFIQELLTPRNVQGRTDFAGGSHYGPSREKSIPQENFAQAAQLLQILSERDKYQSDKGRGDTADDLMRRRLEAERTNLSPGSISMGGETEIVPGKIGVQTPVTSTEAAMTSAAGYPDSRYPPRGFSSGSGGGTAPKDKDLQAKAEFHYKNGQDLREQISMLEPDDPRIPELTAKMNREDAAYEAIAFPTSGNDNPSESWSPGAGRHPWDANEDGVLTQEESAASGYTPARQGATSPSSTQPSPVAMSPATPTPGEKYMGEKMAGFSDPRFNETDPNYIDPSYRVGNFLASVWDSMKPPDQEKIFRQGYDPESGEFITPDNPLWAKVSPQAQKRILARLDAGNDTRRASLDALGYPDYEPVG